MRDQISGLCLESLHSQSVLVITLILLILFIHCFKIEQIILVLEAQRTVLPPRLLCNHCLQLLIRNLLEPPLLPLLDPLPHLLLLERTLVLSLLLNLCLLLNLPLLVIGLPLLLRLPALLLLPRLLKLLHRHHTTLLLLPVLRCGTPAPAPTVSPKHHGSTTFHLFPANISCF